MYGVKNGQMARLIEPAQVTLHQQLLLIACALVIKLYANQTLLQVLAVQSCMTAQFYKGIYFVNCQKTDLAGSFMWGVYVYACL